MQFEQNVTLWASQLGNYIVSQYGYGELQIWTDVHCFEAIPYMDIVTLYYKVFIYRQAPLAKFRRHQAQGSGDLRG